MRRRLLSARTRRDFNIDAKVVSSGLDDNISTYLDLLISGDS
jgi:hypothetical protein